MTNSKISLLSLQINELTELTARAGDKKSRPLLKTAGCLELTLQYRIDDWEEFLHSILKVIKKLSSPPWLAKTMNS